MRLFIFFMVLSASAHAQFNQSRKDIVKYDFSTYIGEPIKTGWLLSDSTYRKLYVSYTAADTMVLYYQQQGAKLEKIASDFESFNQEYKQKAQDDRDLILKQQHDLGVVDQAFTSSQEDNTKILKQFWKIGSIRLHKGTTISVGVSAILVGYLAGKAF